MTLPLVEKYRPSGLGDLIGHQNIIKTINRFLDQDNLPHLLLYGPPGTGKTSTIIAIAKTIFKENEYRSMVLELNASDDRGIGVVRQKIFNFASTRSLFSNKFKLIVLDEADSMTKDAQNALRRIIEKFSETTRFCLICNYVSKIIPALQSRCTRFRFAPIEESQILGRFSDIAQKENIDITDEAQKAIIHFSNGDMRKSLNILQSCHLSSKGEKIDRDYIYQRTGYPSPEDIKKIVQWCIDLPIIDAMKSLSQLQLDKGFALENILVDVIDIVSRLKVPEELKCQLLISLSDIEHALSRGSNDKIQAGSFVAAFNILKSSLSANEI